MSLFNSVTLLRISGLSAFFSVPTYSAHQRTRCVSILNWEKRNRAGYLQCLHVGSGEFKCPLHWQRVEGGHSLTLYLQVQPVREDNVAQNIKKVSLKTCLCLMQGMKCPFFFYKIPNVTLERTQNDTYPFLSYFLKAGNVFSGSSSCKKNINTKCLFASPHLHIEQYFVQKDSFSSRSNSKLITTFLHLKYRLFIRSVKLTPI